MLPNNMSRLTLPGTVALPSPFPTCGILCVEEIDGKKVISITYDADDEYTIIRKVFATDVSAIYLDKTEERGAQWFYTRGSVEPIDSRFGGILPNCLACGDSDSSDEIVKGIVFVPEDTPVLNQVEFGTTAIDSAAYCPPADFVKKFICTVPCDPSGPGPRPCCCPRPSCCH